MKKKIIFLSIFILILLIGGAGIYYYTQSQRDAITYADTEAKYKTYTEEAPTDGTIPTDHNAYENIAYVLWVLGHTQYYSSLTTGTATSVGQKQEIYNHRRVNGDEQLVDTVSSGVVPVGYQKYFSGGKVLLRKYVSKNGNDITWSDEDPECITYQGYIGRYGWLPNQATAYIICPETILEISDVTILENGLYSIKLSLNPDDDYGPFWYRREVATNSSSLTKVVFSSINIEYVFDDNWVVQYVNTQEQYNVTPRVAPITVDCVTDLVEIFDYKNYSFDKKAMDYFDKYSNMTPSDGTIEPSSKMSPLSYITSSLMSSDKEKTFDLNIKINDQIISGKLALDIADLNNIKVKVGIGELQVVYTDETIYIEFNKTKVKGKLSDLSELVGPLDSSGQTSASAGGFDVAAILSDIDSAIVTETDDKVTLDLTLHLLGIELPLSFDIAKLSDNNFDLLAINSQIKLSGVVADIAIVKNESITFDPLTEDYQELTDLDFIMEAVTDIIQNKNVKVNFSGSYEKIDVKGSIIIDFNSNLISKLVLNFEAENFGINETVELFFESEIIYLTYGNVNVKVPLSVLELLTDYNVDIDINKDISSLDINEIINTILSIDFKEILAKISITNDNVEIVSDLSQFFNNLDLIRLVITNNNAGFDVSANYFDLYLSVITSDIDPLSIDYAKYSDALVLADYVKDVLTIIENKHVNVEFTGKSSDLEVSGVAYIDFSAGIKAKVDMDIKYSELIESLTLYYIEDSIYVEYRNVKVKVTKEELSNFIKEMTNESSEIDVEALLTSILDNGLNDVIRSLEISENNVALGISLGEMLLNLELMDTEAGFDVKLNVLDYEFNLVIDTVSTTEFNLDSNEYSDISGYLSFGKYVWELIENGSIGVNLSGEIPAYQISVEGRLDLVPNDNSYDLVGNISLAYNTKELEFMVYYQDQNLYLSVYGQTIKLNVLTATDTLNKIAQTIGLTIPEFDFNSVLGSILETIDSLLITDSAISVNLSNITELLNVLKVTMSSNVGEVKVEADDLFTLDLVLSSSEIKEVDVPLENIIDEQAILVLADYVKDVLTIIENKHVNVEFTGKSSDLEVSGVAYIDFSAGIKAKVDMDIKYSELIESLTLYYIEDSIYVEYRNVKVKVTKEELSNFIKEMTNESSEIDVEALLTSILDNGLNDVIRSLEISENNVALGISLGEMLLNLELMDTEAGFDVKLNVLDYEFNLVIDTVSTTEFNLDSNEYVDSSEMLDTIKFLIGLINKESLLLTISEDSKAAVSIVLNGKEELLSLYGTVDLVYSGNSYSVEANLVVEGLGITTELRAILDNNVVYLTISNQTIVVDLNELDSLVTDVVAKLSSIISFGDEAFPSSLDDSLSLDFLDSLILSNNSLDITITDILADVLKLSLVYSYVADNQQLLMNLNGSYGDISFSLNNLTLASSKTTAINLPTENLITKEEVLDIVDYVVAF